MKKNQLLGFYYSKFLWNPSEDDLYELTWKQKYWLNQLDTF